MNQNLTIKVCSRCGESKPFSDFYKSKPHTCKQCIKDKQAAYYKRNSEKIKSYVKKWREENPEKCKHYHKEYAEKYSEKERERHRIKSKNIPREKQLERERRYGSKYPEKIREKQHRRRVRKRNNGEFLILKKELRKILSMPCQNCGVKENITLDHIIPISRGGRHSVGNLQALCRACNASKRNKLQIEWRAYQRNLI